MGFFEKLSQGLKKTRDSFKQRVEGMLNSFTKIDEDLFDELEEILILADVGAVTAAKICGMLRKKVKETGTTDPAAVTGLLEGIVAELMQGGTEMNLSGSPSVVLVVGVNGAGKTTTIGKMAALYRRQGKNVLLAAADTFRAAAIEQLGVWAERSGVPMVHHEEGSDPAAVVFDALSAAKARKADVVIVDTAGRLHNKKNLMEELSKIRRVISAQLPDAPVETLLVVDATTGQNGVHQAREFKDACDITGIVLTKLDGTAKGGVVLAICDELKLSVKFVGVGEKIDDLQPFDPADFSRALFA